jgi:hypothetical protein
MTQLLLLTEPPLGFQGAEVICGLGGKMIFGIVKLKKTTYFCSSAAI